MYLFFLVYNEKSNRVMYSLLETHDGPYAKQYHTYSTAINSTQTHDHRFEDIPVEVGEVAGCLGKLASQ